MTKDMINRRSFLRSSAAGVAAGAAAAVFHPPTSEAQGMATQGRIAVAAQLFGWTQPISFPNQPGLLDRLDAAFASIKRAGFDNVEGDTTMAANPRFVEALRRHGLGYPASYSGGTFHIEAEAERSIQSIVAQARVARAIGVAVINCNPGVKPGGAEKTDAELAIQARMMDRCGAELRALGLRFAFHNHSPEMRSNARELHYTFRNSDPRNLWYNADVEWIRHGGGDPVRMLEEYGDRTASLHVRDAVGTQWVQALGEGDLDFAGIARVLREKRFAGPLSFEIAIDEHTRVSRSIEENHRISREFIRRVFGA